MSAKNECELKAGRPPAVKAGRMRITQHKPNHEICPSPPSDCNVLKLSVSPPLTNTVSGAPIHGHSDFPAEAVQKFHEKPKPTHEPKCNSMKPVIQQPRK